MSDRSDSRTTETEPEFAQGTRVVFPTNFEWGTVVRGPERVMACDTMYLVQVTSQHSQWVDGRVMKKVHP